MTNILLLAGANRFELTPQLNGVAEFAHRAHWNVHTIGDLSKQTDVKSLFDFWKPSGCIVHCATTFNLFTTRIFGRTPVVYIDRDPARLGRNELCVLHDSAGAGRLAARELLSLELPNYAYVRYRPQWFWCREREQAFAEALRLNGKELTVFQDSSRDNRIDRIKRWLEDLPKPVGIFATNDGVAEKVALAAHELGIDIPNDIALIGVDDVCEICEKSTPTLTSIHPDFVRAGYLAAELLARKIRNPKLKGQIVRYGQTGVVRRQSTRRFPRKDPTVSKLLESIRRRATDASLTIEGLAQEAGCSRRYADMRFREVLRRTILDEIHEVRIGTAKRLLENPSVRITEAAAQSGFKSFATFSRVFTALVGMSPRDYRKRLP